MAFPFVAPFDPWVIDVIETRQKNPIIGSYKNPFVIMTSAARVVKTPGEIPMDPSKRIDILKRLLSPNTTQSSNQIYDGCIISNNVNNLNLSYSHGESGTPVGIDLNGKIIYAEGERNRFVSTPIIQSLDLDTDGANNTLKSAKVKVKCFTLKQLEMFEMFFMKPGMNVLLEFGDSSLLSGLIKYNPELKKQKKVYRNGTQQSFNPVERIEQCLIPKNGGADKFVDEFVNYFRSGLQNSIRYFEKVESSLGTYDLVAGKVINYSFSYQEDGTYDCDIEISQSNQISLALPNNPPKDEASNNTPPANPTVQYLEPSQILDVMVLDFNLDKEKFQQLIVRTPLDTQNTTSLDSWIKKETFNFVKVDEDNKDQKASADAYISLRFIIKILLNYVLSADDGPLQEDFFGLKLPKLLQVGETKLKNPEDILLVKYNKYLLSSNASIIFPSKTLPRVIVTPSGEKQGTTNDVKIEDRIIIDPKTTIDGSINDYELGYQKNELTIVYGNEKNGKIKTKVKADGNELLGNALNVFIRYEDVVRMWNQELFRIDFLEKILGFVNKQSYGLFQLVYAASDDTPSAVPTILDAKFITNDSQLNSLNQEPFRLKLGAKDSIIRNFSFNFEMSNLMAAQSIYGNSRLLYDAATSSSVVRENGIESIIPPDTIYKSFDKSSMANADGWWSLNYVDYKVALAKIIDKKKKITETSGSTKLLTSATPVTLKEEEVNEIIKGNQVVFKMAKGDTNHKALIYTDYSFIYKKIHGDPESKNNVTLSPIDVSFTVDGFSGFRCGYCFLIDGVPEIYNKNGRFQITNVKQSISNDGWQTTVEAGYLPKPIKSAVKVKA